MENEIKFREKICFWLTESFENKIPVDISVINFGINQIDEGVELYFKGYNVYSTENDSWLAKEMYTSENSIIQDKQLNEEPENVYKIYKSEILKFIKSNKSIYSKTIIHTTLTYFKSQPELIFTKKDVTKFMIGAGNSLLKMVLYSLLFLLVIIIIVLIILYFNRDSLVPS